MSDFFRRDPVTGKGFRPLHDKQFYDYNSPVWSPREPDGWDDNQTGNSLKTLWKHIKLAHAGKQKPFTDEQTAKIVKGLNRTVNENRHARIRQRAAAIIICITEDRYDVNFGFRRASRGSMADKRKAQRESRKRNREGVGQPQPDDPAV